MKHFKIYHVRVTNIHKEYNHYMSQSQTKYNNNDIENGERIKETG